MDLIGSSRQIIKYEVARLIRNRYTLLTRTLDNHRELPDRLAVLVNDPSLNAEFIGGYRFVSLRRLLLPP